MGYIGNWGSKEWRSSSWEIKEARSSISENKGCERAGFEGGELNLGVQREGSTVGCAGRPDCSDPDASELDAKTPDATLFHVRVSLLFS